MRTVIAIFLILVVCSIPGFGQKATTVTISSTTSLKDALHICKIEGEVQAFFSDDYGDEPDRFNMQGRDATRAKHGRVRTSPHRLCRRPQEQVGKC
jgi:hypothetical protein